MRPIDADTLKKSIERLCEDERTNMTAITYFALHDLLDTMPTVKAEPDNGWISVKDRLPKEGDDVLVWFEYYRYGEYNCLYQMYGIGTYFENFKSWLINSETGWRDLRVIAWMPLPQKPESEDDAE